MSARRRRDDLDFVLAHRGRRQKRSGRIRRRRRSGALAVIVLTCIVAGIVLAGGGAGVALSASCNLDSLTPVEIGQNSFVYARDGSLLGTIPA